MDNKRNLDCILDKFYENGYNENNRLKKDKAHKIEFITTTKYIEKYLKKGDRILEIGAGTGAYSLYYAEQGYQLDAIELVNSNLDILKSNIKPNMSINAIQGNALDLSMYNDNTFDITLVLGPLYHLFKKEEINRAIEEAIRVTKTNGIVFVAFVLFDLTMLRWGFIDGNLKKNIGEGKMVDNNYRPVNNESLIFNMLYLDEVKELMQEFNVSKLNIVATDGVGRAIDSKINELDDEMYNHYINYHLSICEREDLLGYSGHILYIAKKK